MDKYVKDGKVAVIISEGYGAGWSTWSDSACRETLLFDADIARLVEKLGKAVAKDEIDTIKDDIKKVVRNKCGGVYVYTGGMGGLTLVWLQKGTKFKVREYDGYESIITTDDLIYEA